MSSRIIATGAAALAVITVSGVAAQVRVSGEKIGFPEHFMQGTLYTTVDRADNKQFRELFVSPPAAIEAAKKGEPLPAGTVLTLVQYRARLDGQGNPVKGSDGRFVKGELAGYTVMEKRPGWGADVPEEIRNGDWLYQAFTADGKPNPNANLTACFQCHKPLGTAVDFVYSYDRLKGAMVR
jgi:Cytochrome P460